jgi:SAM-dependent methyltransferase
MPRLEPELVCPRCLGPLTALAAATAGPPPVACEGCACTYLADAGWLDFIGLPDPGAGRLGPRLMHSPAFAAVYERLWRPTFVAVASAGTADRGQEAEAVDEALAGAVAGVVVDLSCGPGFTGRRLAATGRFARVYGLDGSVAMLQRAAQARDPGLRLVRADVARLPFADASLAGVHAGAALHVWPDPPSAIAEVARTLRPGGVFVASTFAYPRLAVLRPLAASFQLVSGARVFEVEELAGHCRTHGLVDFTVERRGALIFFTAVRD